MREPLVWAVTTGEAGYRSQALGLAEAIGGTVVEKQIDLRWPWRLLPGHLCPTPLTRLDPARDTLAPPWPDVLVTCGRRSTGPSIAIRRASGGRTLTVHVQNPNTPRNAFDLIVPMVHDGLTGENVLPVAAALHRVTAQRLADAAAIWAPRFATIPSPRVGVLIGGATKNGNFDEAMGSALIADLKRLHEARSAGLMITPSRRTPAAFAAALATEIGGEAWSYVWDGAGQNPYLGILAIADAFVVSADSVSMISEAIATGKPVAVARLGTTSGAPRRFLDALMAEKLAAPFTGDIPAATPPSTPARDATEIAAERVRQMLAARG